MPFQGARHNTYSLSCVPRCRWHGVIMPIIHRRLDAHISQKYWSLLKGTHSWPWFSPRRCFLSRDERKRRLPLRWHRGLTGYLPTSPQCAFTYDKWSLRKRQPGIRFILQSTYLYQKSTVRRVRLKGGITMRQAAIHRNDPYEYQNFYSKQMENADTSNTE